MSATEHAGLAEQTWVVTGSSGSVGRCVVAGLAPLVGNLRLVDIVPPADTVPHNSAFTLADV